MSIQMEPTIMTINVGSTKDQRQLRQEHGGATVLEKNLVMQLLTLSNMQLFPCQMIETLLGLQNK